MSNYCIVLNITVKEGFVEDLEKQLFELARDHQINNLQIHREAE